MTPQRRAVERLSVKLLLAIAVVGLACLLLPKVWQYLSPFLIALPLAAMIQPIARFLERMLHLRHTPAVLIPVLLLIMILLGAVIWFSSFGLRQLSGIQPDQLITDIDVGVRQALNHLLGVVDDHLENPEVLINSVNSAMAELSEWGRSLAGQFLDMLISTAVGVPYVLIYINFLFMGLYFIAKDYDRILSFLPHRRKTISDSETAKLASSAISGAIGYLKVQLIYAALSLASGLIYWHIVGSRYATLIAVVAGVLEFIPLVGNGALYLPWALIALIGGNVGRAMLPLALYLALFLIRRLTEPKLMAQRIGITPLLSLISMFMGITAGGILGLIAGPVLMTVAVAFLKSREIGVIRSDVHVLVDAARRRWSDENLTASPPAAAKEPLPDEAPPPDEFPVDGKAAAEADAASEPKSPPDP